MWPKCNLFSGPSYDMTIGHRVSIPLLTQTLTVRVLPYFVFIPTTRMWHPGSNKTTQIKLKQRIINQAVHKWNNGINTYRERDKKPLELWAAFNIIYALPQARYTSCFPRLIARGPETFEHGPALPTPHKSNVGVDLGIDSPCSL